MNWRKKFWFVSGLLVLMAVSGWALHEFNERNSAESVKIRSASLDTNYLFPDRKGAKHRVGEYAGKWMLIHFWASWCAPCVEEIPELLAFVRSFDDPDLRFLAVSLDDSWEAADRILKPEELPPRLTSVIDVSKGFPESLGITQYPETLLVGPDRKILARWIGAQKWTDRAWSNALRERMVSQTPGVPALAR